MFSILSSWSTQRAIRQRLDVAGVQRWLAKAPQDMLSLPSWLGVPLPQKHNGSGLLQCDPGEGREHQVARARGAGWWVARALCGIIFFLQWGKKGPCPLLHNHSKLRQALLSSTSSHEHVWVAHWVSSRCAPSVGKWVEIGTR